MTNKKKQKPPESSETNSANKTELFKAKQDIHGDNFFLGLDSVHHYIAKDSATVTVTRSKLPEPTETPPPPRVAKPKK